MTLQQALYERKKEREAILEEMAKARAIIGRARRPSDSEHNLAFDDGCDAAFDAIDSLIRRRGEEK